MAFYPCLVAEEEGGILGYAYASRFHARAAYAWSAEVTIYLAQEARGRGLGSALYHRLEGYLKGMRILNCNACIASTAHATAYLTNSSQVFHEKLGYRLVGRFHQSGYKFNQWFDMIWMEKLLGEHDVRPRSEEHTSELQSRQYLVCRLLLEKKKNKYIQILNYVLILEVQHYVL